MGLGRNYYMNSTRGNVSPNYATNNSIAVIQNDKQFSSTFSDYGTSLFNPLTVNNQQASIGCQNIGFLN